MKTLKRLYSKSHESLVDVNLRKCEYCRVQFASFVRKLDISKIPNQYFINVNDHAFQMIVSHPDTVPSNRYHFINLPPQYVLSKYHSYACYKCYLNEVKECLPWNYWQEL